jgi:sugar/nucleoside kinase (ribokinase family)
MYDICCIGHITLDKVVTPETEIFMAGGTSFYFSNAIRQMDVKYGLVTALAESEMRFADSLVTNGTNVLTLPSAHTVYFENIYSKNLDHRTQRVLQTADPFTVKQLQQLEATIFHLGPLLADDISLDVIKMLAQKGKLSLDVQGYLRTVENQQVVPADWKDKMQALPYIGILKVNEMEMEVLTGLTDVEMAARLLNQWGVGEVVITLGSKGSVIFTADTFYTIPAYKPDSLADATGCGDTYMAGYLYKRVKGYNPQQAGEFGAAMASLKISFPGPFVGKEEDVLNVIAGRQKLV